MKSQLATALLLASVGCGGSIDAVGSGDRASPNSSGTQPTLPSPSGTPPEALPDDVVDGPSESTVPAQEGSPNLGCGTVFQGPLPEGRGMVTPWTELQAESGTTNALILGPSRAPSDRDARLESEAIGRKAVRLTKLGDYVAFETPVPANSLVVRYAIPDGPDVTLGLYVDGKRIRSLSLTARYTWSYGSSDDPTSDASPGAGRPHAFFDELRVRLDDIPAGAELKLQKDAEDRADFYVVDLIDLEAAPPPRSMPSGFVSVGDFGAVPDDGADDGAAVQRALQASDKLWFPPGTYDLDESSTGAPSLENRGEVRGAGEWHTVLRGRHASFTCSPAAERCVLGDLTLRGDTSGAGDTRSAEAAVFGPMAAGSLIERIWIEHARAGIRVGADAPLQREPSHGLLVRDVRVRNVFGAGIELGNGTSEARVESAHVRGSGGDAFAIWSKKWSDWSRAVAFTDGADAVQDAGNTARDQGAATGNTFAHVTAQMPWRGACFAVYGGSDNHFSNSVCEDTLSGAGLHIASDRWSYGFAGEPSTFRDLTLVHAGGSDGFENDGHQRQRGAVELDRRQGSIEDIVLQDVHVIDPTFSGIVLRGFGHDYGWASSPPWELDRGDAAIFQDVTLRRVRVYDACGYGIQVRDGGGRGRIGFEAVFITNPQLGGLDRGGAPDSFFIRGVDNQGW